MTWFLSVLGTKGCMIYIDHERPDVKEYRDMIFLPEMKGIDRLTTRYIEVNNKLEVSHPNLLPREKRHVV